MPSFNASEVMIYDFFMKLLLRVPLIRQRVCLFVRQTPIFCTFSAFKPLMIKSGRTLYMHLFDNNIDLQIMCIC